MTDLPSLIAPTKYILTRTVTRKECNWLSKMHRKGAVVYEYDGCTYGCVGRGGIACTEQPDKTPFFELPADALEKQP